MSDTVPSGRRIDRASLERIIQRAAELQASERDLGEGLTEAELMQLGSEVGIAAGHMRQAMLEEQTRARVVPERGLGVFLAGPSRAVAERVIPRDAKSTRDALHWWMDEGEVLQVKRRFPDVTVWEGKKGAVAAMKRKFGPGGGDRRLSQMHEVSGSVTDLGDGRSHVRLEGDLHDKRQGRIAGAVTLIAAGAVASAAAIGVGVELWAASLALPLGGIMGYGVARSQWQEVERAHLALEQVLDRLEHGDIQVPRQVAGPRASAFVRMADEIRKSFGI